MKIRTSSLTLLMVGLLCLVALLVQMEDVSAFSSVSPNLLLQRRRPEQILGSDPFRANKASSFSLIFRGSHENRRRIHGNAAEGELGLANASSGHKVPFLRTRGRQWWTKWTVRGLLVALLAASVVCLFPRSVMASSAAATLTAADPARMGSALASAAESAAAASTVAAKPVMQMATLASPVSRQMELLLICRLCFASVLGAAVGKERSDTNHQAAGVRTMALVSTGAACFTLCSLYGFAAAAGGRYDPSRMAANVASGVGFVGAGVITTTTSQQNNNRSTDDGGAAANTSIVRGLTTAAAIWLSAAVGVSCGVGMYYLASAAALLTITILRFGRVTKPQSPFQQNQNKNASFNRKVDIIRRESSSDFSSLSSQQQRSIDQDTTTRRQPMVGETSSPSSSYLHRQHHQVSDKVQDSPLQQPHRVRLDDTELVKMMTEAASNDFAAELFNNPASSFNNREEWHDQTIFRSSKVRSNETDKMAP